MKTLIIVITFILSCFTTVYAYNDMTLISKSPLTVSDENTNKVSVVFNKTVTSFSANAKNENICPITLYKVKNKIPSDFEVQKNNSDIVELERVSGRCRWQGTQTAVFEADSPFSNSSLYKAQVLKGVKSFDGNDITSDDTVWYFETPRQQLLETSPDNESRWVDDKSILFAAFRYPVIPQELEKYIVLSDKGANSAEVKISLRRATKEEVDKLWAYSTNFSTTNVLAIIPQKLELDKKYEIIFKQGLPAAHSNLGILKDEVKTFYTISPLSLLESAKSECLPYNPSFKFSNPVKYSELIKNTKISPQTDISVSVYGSNSDSEDGVNYNNEYAQLYLSGANLRTNTEYTVTFLKGLTDIFGNKLKNDIVAQFKTGDICPYINVSGGFGVMESNYPARHPVEVVNSGEIELTKIGLTKDNFIPFYKGGVNKYPAEAFTKKWNPSENAKNTRIYTFVDFEKVRENSRSGFFYAKLMSKNRDYTYPVQIWDNSTDLGLTVKTSPDNILIWTTYLRTGKVAARIPVQIRDSDNKILWRGITDNSGFALAPGIENIGLKKWGKWERPEVWVFADSVKGDAVMNSLWNNGVEPWRFSLDYEYFTRKKTYSASVFTDRGIYRTGEKVNFKGVLRRLSGGDWKKADVKKVKLSVFDSLQNKVHSAVLNVSSSSSFDGEFVIPNGSATGVWNYSIDSLTDSDEQINKLIHMGYSEDESLLHFAGNFRVDEFKTADFAVKTVPLKNDYMLGDKFEAVVESHYLSGGSMNNSKLDWNLRLERTDFAPKGFDSYNFGDYSDGLTVKTIASGTKKLNAKGNVKVAVKLPKKISGSGLIRAVFEAGVSAANGQHLFSRGYAFVHRADIYPGIKLKNNFTEQGKEWSADIIALSSEGKILAGKNLKAEIVKEKWYGVHRAGLGGRLEWVNSSKEIPVITKNIVSAEKPVEISFVPDEGGSYIIRLSGEDGKGNKTVTSVSFYVSGNAWWKQEDSDIVEVIPEKDTYSVGEDADFMIKSPWDNATALITVEREGVMNHFVHKIVGGADKVRIPVKEEYIPNAYISVVIVKGRTENNNCLASNCEDAGKPQGRFGYATFKVNPRERNINVSAKTDKADYRPGDTVKLKIKTTDDSNKPLKTEITVSVVDEGVLSLTAYTTPNIFSDFYGSRPLNVTTADSRLNIIGQRNYGEKGERRGGGGGFSLSGADLRANFMPTAYWNPSVKTNINGEAEVSFVLPDNLTRFKVSLTAAEDKRFGSGETSFTVSKPLMLRSALPFFARVGDKFNCGSILQNFSHETISGNYQAAIKGNSITSSNNGRQDFSLAPGEILSFNNNCKAGQKGEASFIFSASADKEKDALKYDLPVRETDNYEYAFLFGTTENKIKQGMEIPYPGAKGEVSIALSSNSGAELKGVENYINNYEYASLSVRLSQAYLALLKNDKKQAVSIINGLGGYQTENGGFSYWINGKNSDTYVTAFFMEVANNIKNLKGFNLQNSLKRARERLSHTLNNSEERDNNAVYPYSEGEKQVIFAYSLYVLSLYGEDVKGHIGNMYRDYARLPLMAKVYLIHAMNKTGYDKKAEKNLYDEIISSAKTSGAVTYFNNAEDMSWLHMSEVKNTADVLYALLETNGGFYGDEKALMRLSNEIKVKGSCGNIADNIACYRAFNAYGKKYKNGAAEIKAQVSVENKPLAKEFVLNGNNKEAVYTISFDNIFANTDKTEIVISKTGEGRLYYGVKMKFIPQNINIAQSEGLEISKVVKPVNGGKIKVGDRAVVTITVKTPQNRMFVAVNDPVPAGFEIVNTDLETESENNTQIQNNQGFSNAQKYADRMVLYADYLETGEYKYSYLVEAVTSGTFITPSSKAECMYDASVFAKTVPYITEIEP